MQKKLIATAVAIALQSYCIPAFSANNNVGKNICPDNIQQLSEKERSKLPAACLAEPEQDNFWGWAAGGVAALATGIALIVDNNDGGSSHHSTPSPTPPDDGGDVTPTPPDDGGDVTPTPPDDGGDVTPTPPDDNAIKTFSNGVTLDKNANTLHFDDVKLVDGTHLGEATLSYSDVNGKWQLVTNDGKKLTVTGWSVTSDNAAVIEGTRENGLYWKYDAQGNLILASDQTHIFDDDATVNDLDVDGEGNTGGIISGDDTVNTLDGESTILDGATGLVISGDGTTNTLSGDTTVDGDGSTGVVISGDDTHTTHDGNMTVNGGGTGIVIDGDGSAFENKGKISVDGEGSTGVDFNGNNSSLVQNGELLVTNGATGAIVRGTGNRVANTGKTTVRDAGSTGFVVDGEQNAFTNTGDIDVSLEGTGALISGTASQVKLDSNITVYSAADSEGNFHGATGVNVSGDSNTVDIVGNVSLSADFAKGSPIDETTSSLTGVTVNGNNNTVNLDGTLSITVNNAGLGGKTSFGAVGLDVKGDGNHVALNGGINLSHDQNAQKTNTDVTGISIKGASEVTLSGHSVLDTTSISGGGQLTLAQVSNGGSFILNEDSVVDLNVRYTSGKLFTEEALLMADGEGSSIENNGVINSKNAYTILLADNGAAVSNSGDILVYESDQRAAIIRAKGTGSAAHNQAGGDITLISDQYPKSSGGNSYYPLKFYTHDYYAMLASDYGEVINDKGATIHLQGAGVYGLAASKGTARNDGEINLDGFVPTLDDQNTITDKNYWAPSSLYLTSAAMVAGSTDKGNGDATVMNTGTINVNNAGFGMMALNGGTAINQGTINLTADEGVQGTDANQLVAMAAINGGTVINDTSGVININADYAKPFYTDSQSTVVNYGTVCFDSACQDSEQYNPTDNAVALAFKNGEEITAQGETLANTKVITDPTASDTVHVTNAGTISGGSVTVKNYGDLTNTSTGSISSVNIQKGGRYTNEGATSTVSVDGGVFTNTGTVTGETGTTVAGSVINNSGSMASVEQWASTMNNTGTVNTWEGASASAVLNNGAGGVVNELDFTAAATVNNAGVINKGGVDKGGILNNLEGGVITLDDKSLWSGTFNNWGTVNSDADIATTDSGHTLYNGATGIINGQITTSANSGGSKAINDGTINIDKTGNVAMSAHGSAKMVNNGTINVGTKGTQQTDMVGMQLESDAKSDGVIENNGSINIYANNSYAFSQLGSNGHIVNNGTVYIDDSVTGSGFIKQEGKTVEGKGEGGDGTEVHYVDYTAPTEPTLPDAATDAPSGKSSTNDLSGYVVGTKADGSAGKLMVNNASMNGVGINTGFTAGTDETTVTFDNVVEGSNLSDASAIQSTSVVWNAQGNQDNDGNIDVTMTKNAYADVVTDSSVSDVAQALDNSYTNNELYTSLNVATTAELNSALKQVSGSQATTVSRETRVLSNRFNMLADAAPQVSNSLAFNVIAKGDPRAELGDDTQYDMLALRQKLDLTSTQNMTLEYGIARLDGDGAKKAGDNGLTGGYSQFFGLKHSMAFEEGFSWNNALRYDVHNLDSSRSVSYGDVNKVADSASRQQYLEFRSEGAKTFTLLNDALKVTPYAGVKFRHTLEDGYKERSAGDFNLSMNSSNETAVDSIVGLKLDYRGENGWGMNATLEGGPNLNYTRNQRVASLQGAVGQKFSIDDGQKGGGVNGLATLGVKYSTQDTALHLDTYQWKEDGISDKGFMLNFRKTFR